MNVKQFTFNKKWYPTKELLEIIPISRSTFYKMHRELIEQGLGVFNNNHKEEATI